MRDFRDRRQRLETLTRPRRFRRPDRNAIDETQNRIGAQQRYLDRLEKERTRSGDDLDRSRHRLHDAERTVARIPEVESAITRRHDWILSHPAELAWEADLAARLGQAPDPPDHDQFGIEDALEVIRSVDLSRAQPRTGIERRLREVLGVKPTDPINLPLPRLPARGIDGPDLGL